MSTDGKPKDRHLKRIERYRELPESVKIKLTVDDIINIVVHLGVSKDGVGRSLTDEQVYSKINTLIDELIDI